MESLNQLVNQINGLVWGPPMLVLILGTGFFLMVLLKLMPLRRIGTGFAMIWRGRHRGDPLLGRRLRGRAAVIAVVGGRRGRGRVAE